MIERLRNLKRAGRFMRAVQRAAVTTVEAQAKRNCVVNKMVGRGGSMRDSITTAPAEIHGGDISVRVGVPGGPDGHPYARYVEFGTGLFGPLHRRIRPVHAKALAWESGSATVRVQPLGAGLRMRQNPKTGKVTYSLPKKIRMVFHQMTIMRSTKGMEAQEFLGPAVRTQGAAWARNVMTALMKLAKGAVE